MGNNNNKEQNKLLSELRHELVQAEDLKDELEAKIKELQADQEIVGLLEEKLKETQDGQSEEVYRLKMQVDTLNNNSKEQNKLLSDLRYELALTEDLKDELEAKIKELESSESNEYVKKIRDKMAAQPLELASMKVELKQSEGNQSNAVRKVNLELEAERGQVKRLKEEIRRMTISQRSAAKDLDSTYVAPARSNRQPLAEKPVEVACKNCQNIEGNKGHDKARIQDEDAFMKYEGKGNFVTGCGVAKEMFLEQAKDKVRKMTLELGNKDKEIQFYKDTHMKWKRRTLALQDNVKRCPQCVGYVEDFTKK